MYNMAPFTVCALYYRRLAATVNFPTRSVHQRTKSPRFSLDLIKRLLLGLGDKTSEHGRGGRE